MRAIFWLNGQLVRVLCVLSVLLIAAMMLSISAEVLLRMAGGSSIPGMIELTEYALFASTFFVAPYLLRTNEHIRVDLVIARLDPAKTRMVECCVLVVIMAISLITGIIATILMVRSYQADTLIFKDLIFPQWWLDWVIPLSMLAMLLQAAELFVTLVRTPAGGVPLAAEGVPGIRPDEMP
jgi:TRAP-type C4-dicarboxylate transport system permease small subunit